MFQNEFVRKETQTQTLDEVNELTLINGMGDIKISPGKNGEISVLAVKRVRTKDRAIKNEIMDNILIEQELQRNTVLIHAVAKDHSDLWEWKQNHYQSVNISVDYEVKIPQGVKVYTVQNGMGDIKMDDIEGAVQIQNDMGEVKLSKVILEGECSVTTNLGNINLNVRNMEQANAIRLASDLGNINIKVPGKARYNLETKISNDASKKQTVSGGGTDLTAVADLGFIKVNGKRQ
ncbi:DUF4097 family beta strand repeat-containing protein [Paenibacillus caui]|uniref:DUF4097 family beta strand repeat-containing protein n=1 Tax=Paenibacillus caui TaxID=2873927 RepID=UPI001CA7F5A8|nr:DUF4097 family beta strand repeat-containing protein [Paenibacillus caui]